MAMSWVRKVDRCSETEDDFGGMCYMNPRLAAEIPPKSLMIFLRSCVKCSSYVRLYHRIRLKGIMAVLFLFTNLPVPVLAGSYFDGGLQFFQKKDFRTALAYFSQALRDNPFDPNALYYQAMTFQMLGDRASATSDYARLITQFTDCSARSMAIVALARLDPNYCRSLLHGTGRPSSSGARTTVLGQSQDTSKLPSQCRVDFQRKQDNTALLVLRGRLNGRECNFVFDTGASESCIGMDALKDAGLSIPHDAPVVKVSGVGGGGMAEARRMNVSIQVGTITRTTSVLVLEDRADSLLGQTFFQDFTYTIDTDLGNPNAGTICFSRRNGGTTANLGRSSVKFDSVDGAHIVVPVNVEGRPTKMIFDTGATGIMFTREQLSSLHIAIPEDAEPIKNRGIGGETTGLIFSVRRMSMGPIDKFDVPVGVVDGARIPYPLLGQAFFSDYKYTIDYDNKVINFQRR
jgi:predicted aspartyl protease